MLKFLKKILIYIITELISICVFIFNMFTHTIKLSKIISKLSRIRKFIVGLIYLIFPNLYRTNSKKQRFFYINKRTQVKLLLSYTAILSIYLIIFYFILVSILYFDSSEELKYISFYNDITVQEFTNDKILNNCLESFENFLKLREEDCYTLLDIQITTDNIFYTKDPSDLDLRPEHLTLKGFEKKESFCDKLYFVRLYLFELITFDSVVQGCETNDMFINSYLKGFFKDTKTLLSIHTKSLLKSPELIDSIYTFKGNRLVLFIDGNTILNLLENKYYKIILIENHIHTLFNYITNILVTSPTSIKLESGIETISINSLDYQVLYTEKYKSLYIIKKCLYFIILVHCILGVITFIYDYFLKRMEIISLRSLWIFFLSILIVVSVVLPYTCGFIYIYGL